MQGAWTGDMPVTENLENPQGAPGRGGARTRAGRPSYWPCGTSWINLPLPLPVAQAIGSGPGPDFRGAVLALFRQSTPQLPWPQDERK